MTQQEFEQRVGMSVNATEYASIENVLPIRNNRQIRGNKRF